MRPESFKISTTRPHIFGLYCSTLLSSRPCPVRASFKRAACTERKAYVCTASSHLHVRQTEGLSLRAKIEFLRELPAHYQTPALIFLSASVHEEVATFYCDGCTFLTKIVCLIHNAINQNSLNHVSSPKKLSSLSTCSSCMQYAASVRYRRSSGHAFVYTEESDTKKRM